MARTILIVHEMLDLSVDHGDSWEVCMMLCIKSFCLLSCV